MCSVEVRGADLEAAHLLLSAAASPSNVCETNRVRSWSSQSLETLVDVATANYAARCTMELKKPRLEKKIVVGPSPTIVGRSLLQKKKNASNNHVQKLVVVKEEQPRKIIGSDVHICPSILPTKFKGIYYRDGRVGVYSPSERKVLIQKFLRKRNQRVWSKKVVRYSCRKDLAQQRVRIKGRFVKATQ